MSSYSPARGGIATIGKNGKRTVLRGAALAETIRRKARLAKQATPEDTPPPGPGHDGAGYGKGNGLSAVSPPQLIKAPTRSKNLLVMAARFGKSKESQSFVAPSAHLTSTDAERHVGLVLQRTETHERRDRQDEEEVRP